MAEFKYLMKSDFELLLPFLFQILADNMTKIAPGNTREEDFNIWKKAVSEALQKSNREIILILESNTKKIIGYFQYSINGATLLMEEFQITAVYQGKENIFRDLYTFFIANIHADMVYVEAYAHMQNHKSIGILNKLGLKKIGEGKNKKSYHFRGAYGDLLQWHRMK